VKGVDQLSWPTLTSDLVDSIMIQICSSVKVASIIELVFGQVTVWGICEEYSALLFGVNGDIVG